MEPPEGLGDAGRALWARIIGDLAEDWRLDERELHVLGRACRCADDIAAIEAQVDADGPIVRGSRGQPVAHPGLSEVRQLRLAESKLLATLELSPPEEKLPAQTRAQRAAATRWSRERRERARAHGVPRDVRAV